MVDQIDLGIDGIGPATLVGRGGSAYVYRAEQEDFGRKVAVKVLFDALEDDATYRRFDRECRAIGAVSDHPNIVVVHGRGLTGDDRPYLVMEYRSGGSLAESLTKRGRLTEAEVVRIGVKIGNALAVAHKAGVLHRDVKPGNILLSTYNEPALADFGIARVEGGHKTTQQTFSASVAHASREVLDEGEPTPQSDVYALGSTLFELVTGAPAFTRPDDDSVWAVINRVLSEDPPDPKLSGVSDELAAIVSKAMRHDPAARHQSAAELVEELQELDSDQGRPRRSTGNAATETTLQVEEIPGPSTPTDARPGPTGPNGSRIGLLVGLGVLALGTIAAAAVALQRTNLGDGGDVESASVAGPASNSDGSATTVASLDGQGVPAAANEDGEDTNPDDETRPSSIPELAEPSQLVFPRAAIGPLDADGRYILSLDVVPDSAGYRIVVDGRKITDYQPDIPIFFPEAGRHQVQLQVAQDSFVFLTDPVEIYVADAPEPGFRANLSAIRSQPENWPEALRQFDQLVLDGHEDLELSLSDRKDRGRFAYWNYYVDGFGEDQGAAEAYCDSFSLTPDQCFVARV